MLEDRFTLVLVNARHVHQVPGHKTNVRVCEWLAELFARAVLGGEARVREVHERGCYWSSSGPTCEAEACYCTSSLEAKTESASGVSQASICRSWNF
jgi:hypothetical protein